MSLRRALAIILLALLVVPVLGQPALAATATYKGLICIGDVYEAMFNTTGSYVRLVNRSYINYTGTVYPGDTIYLYWPVTIKAENVAITPNTTILPHLYNLKLKGASDCVVFFGYNILAPSDFVINAEVKPTDLTICSSTDTYRDITVWRDNGVPILFLHLRIDSDVAGNALTAYVHDGGVFERSSLSANEWGATPNLWYNVTFEFHNASTSYLIVGAASASGTLTMKQYTINTIRVGGGRVTGFVGEIAYVYARDLVNSKYIVFIDPTFFNGTYYFDAASGALGTPYGGAERVPAEHKWLWVIRDLRSDNKVHLEWFPRGSVVEFYDADTGALVAKVVVTGNDVAISLPPGRYTIVAHIPVQVEDRPYYQVEGTYSVARNAELQADRTGIYVIDKGYYYTWTGTIYGNEVFEANETGIYKIGENPHTVPVQRSYSDSFDWSYTNSGRGKVAETRVLTTDWYFQVREDSVGTNDPFWRITTGDITSAIKLYLDDVTRGDGGDYLDFYTKNIIDARYIEVEFKVYLPDWTHGEGAVHFGVYGSSGGAWWRGVAYTNEKVFIVSNGATSSTVTLTGGPSFLGGFELVKFVIDVNNKVTKLYYYDSTTGTWVLWASVNLAPQPPFGIKFMIGTWSGWSHTVYCEYVKVTYTIDEYYMTVYCPPGSAIYVYDSAGNLVASTVDSDNNGAENITISQALLPITDGKLLVRNPDRDYAIINVDAGSKVEIRDASGVLLVSTSDSDNDGVVTCTLDYEGYQSLSYKVTYGGDWRLHVYSPRGVLFVDGSNVTSSVTSGWYNVSWVEPRGSVLEWAETGYIKVIGVPGMQVKVYDDAGALVGVWSDDDLDGLVQFVPPFTCISGVLEVSAAVSTGSFVFTGTLYPGDVFYFTNDTVKYISRVYGTGLWFQNFTRWRLVVYTAASWSPELNVTITSFNYSIYLTAPVSGGVLISIPDKTIVVRLGSPILAPTGKATVPTVNPFNPYQIVPLPPPPGVLQFLEPGYGTAQGIIAAGMLIGIYLALSRGEEEDTAGGVALASALTIVVGLVLGSYQVVMVAAVALALSLAYAFAKR